MVSLSWLVEVDDPASNRPVTLCHHPMMTWNHARKGRLHLFGHVHGNRQGSANAVNVEVDAWNFSTRRRCMKPHGGRKRCRRTSTGRMSIPVMPAMAGLIDTMPADRMLILVSDRGRPMTGRHASDDLRCWRNKPGLTPEALGYDS
ncbi:metallophosphoesterase family protein [Paracoccus binzhouensis]|uniref:hypothetical protein n=1 Tax=Paracoccus binzhouensis TaxID=2796149 RepID=UPI001E4EC136|nr:hypothetical protein [Paracoccus binzhouensis]